MGNTVRTSADCAGETGVLHQSLNHTSQSSVTKLNLNPENMWLTAKQSD